MDAPLQKQLKAFCFHLELLLFCGSSHQHWDEVLTWESGGPRCVAKAEMSRAHLPLGDESSSFSPLQLSGMGNGLPGGTEE